MNEKQFFVLSRKEARSRAIDAVKNAPDGYAVHIKPPTRSLEANAAQWPILQAFADQLEWPVNGQMTKLTADEFKDILTAAFKQETARVAMGLNGGVVMLGNRTSKFSVKRFSEWLDFLKCVAAERGISCD